MKQFRISQYWWKKFIRDMNHLATRDLPVTRILKWCEYGTADCRYQGRQLKRILSEVVLLLTITNTKRYRGCDILCCVFLMYFSRLYCYNLLCNFFCHSIVFQNIWISTQYHTCSCRFFKSTFLSWGALWW